MGTKLANVLANNWLIIGKISWFIKTEMFQIPFRFTQDFQGNSKIELAYSAEITTQFLSQMGCVLFFFVWGAACGVLLNIRISRFACFSSYDVGLQNRRIILRSLLQNWFEVGMLQMIANRD